MGRNYSHESLVVKQRKSVKLECSRSSLFSGRTADFACITSYKWAVFGLSILGLSME